HHRGDDRRTRRAAPADPGFNAQRPGGEPRAAKRRRGKQSRGTQNRYPQEGQAMPQPPRRGFLQATLAGGAALATARQLQAIEPIQRSGKPHLKLSLAAYSFNRYMSLTGKTKPTMSMDDFVDFAAGIWLDPV